MTTLKPLKQPEDNYCKYFGMCSLDCRGCELANNEANTRTYYESTKKLRGNLK